MSQIEIFFSYSHKDESFKDELEKQLSLLRWQGVITNWTDRRIVAGQEWADEISKHLDTAQIILLLISPDFLASPYCYSIEMKRAVERHDRGEAHVIPIILRSVYWQDAPFGKLQALPKDAKPVKGWPDQDEAFYNVAEGIRKVVNELQAKLVDVPTKAPKQPNAPSIPQVQPLPENVSQPNMLSETSANTANKVVSSVNPPIVPDEITTKLSSIQIFKMVQLKFILTGHLNAVSSVAISLDGQTIVSGSYDTTLRVWNLHTGTLIRTLKGHLGRGVFPRGPVRAIAISSNGQHLISNGEDTHTIRIWNLYSGELLRVLTGHEREVDSVTISFDGQTIVSGSDDKTVRVWSLQSGELLRTLVGHENWVKSVAISPDGQTIISGSFDDTVRVWNLHSGELLDTLTGHESLVNSVAISPDGQTIVSGSDDKTVRVWNLHSGELLRVLTGHEKWVKSVAISPDGQTIVSGSDDKTVRVWNLHSGKVLRTLAGHENKVVSVAISPDGHTIISGSHDKTIRIWSL